ncbi:DNA-binding protein [Chryseobacterium angstadtii]|uniref:DNA-binding protein n=1 Tax=Chryseobacterium angstadtii TaxID=558151 RepID=A0A0J7IEM0_9FLAO|nr:helix-turn-helix domain-containing protein [Chryseobacterium angstadtii]KMQ64572.1 DNA-binding protein [Chryseobacterium angstadtii]
MEQPTESSGEIISLLETIVQLKKQLLVIKESFRPVLGGEIYLSGEELCGLLHIGRRTLQQYRDDCILPYVQIEGKILYRESDILKLLEENYRKRRK